MINQLMINLGLNTAGLRAGLASVKSMLGGLVGGGGWLGMGVMAAGAITKNFIDWEHEINLLGVVASLSKEQISKMKKEINNTAMETGVSRNELAKASQTIVDYTGNLEYSVEIQKQLALAHTATGASMEDLGKVASSMNMLYGATAEETSRLMDIIVGQGKTGSYPFRQMATEIAPLLTTAKSLGLTMKDLPDYFANMQMLYPQFMGTPGELSTSIDAMKRAIVNTVKQAKLEKKFSFVFDFEKKNLSDMIDEVLTVTNGDLGGIGRFMTPEMSKMYGVLAPEYKAAYNEARKTSPHLEAQAKAIEKIHGKKSRFDQDYTDVVKIDAKFMEMNDKSTKLDKIWTSLVDITDKLFEKPLNRIEQMGNTRIGKVIGWTAETTGDAIDFGLYTGQNVVEAFASPFTGQRMSAVTDLEYNKPKWMQNNEALLQQQAYYMTNTNIPDPKKINAVNYAQRNKGYNPNEISRRGTYFSTDINTPENIPTIYITNVSTPTGIKTEVKQGNAKLNIVKKTTVKGSGQ